MRFVLLVSAVLFFSCSKRTYSTGNIENDSSYIYRLPFVTGKKVFLLQGYDTRWSHKGELALDFKVRKGTKICAARDGIVIATRENSNKGGLKKANLADGNFIIIQHVDQSCGWYWHLQKDGVLVKDGDTVRAGQVIGLSGNTGYSAFPHLHFEVRGYDSSGNYVQLPTRFKTNKGVIYLRQMRCYRVQDL
jgi:murein DD-endopeptidase MepM/ murein hydrolase activator NlpD